MLWDKDEPIGLADIECKLPGAISCECVTSSGRIAHDAKIVCCVEIVHSTTNCLATDLAEGTQAFPLDGAFVAKLVTAERDIHSDAECNE